MLQGFLLVILVLICIALGTVILLQRSEGGAFGMGGGPSGLLTARGAGDLLTRITSILAAAFFILCLLLTILSGHRTGESVVDRLKVDALNPDALNNSMRPAAAPAGPVGSTGSANAPLPLAATPSTTAPTGSTSSASAHAGAAPAPAKPSFEAPAPEVHTAPSASGGKAPAVTTDSGARSRVSNLLGYQTAPQAQPTVAPQPAKPAAVKPAAAPSTSASSPPTSAPSPQPATTSAGNTGQ